MWSNHGVIANGLKEKNILQTVYFEKHIPSCFIYNNVYSRTEKEKKPTLLIIA